MCSTSGEVEQEETSEIMGGKFANGAITGAFVHLFNNENGGSLKKTFDKFREGCEHVGDYFARITYYRDSESVIMGSYYHDQAVQETKETAKLLVNVIEHPKLAAEAYAKYNDYNYDQLKVDTVVKGYASRFLTGIPFLISSIGNTGHQAAEINRYINENK